MSIEQPDFEKQHIEPEETLAQDEPTSEKSHPGRLKKWFLNMTAASAMVAGSDIAEAQTPSAKPEGQKPATENVQQTEKERAQKQKELNEKCQLWLDELGVKSLKAGDYTLKGRSSRDAIGIYMDGKQIGNVWSLPFQNHTRQSVLEETIKVLDEQKIKYTKPAETQNEFTIGVGVMEKLKELDMKFNPKYLGKDGKNKISISANTELQDQKDALFFEIDIDTDSNPQTYASLEVNGDGDLILKGKDGSLFKFQFMKDTTTNKVIMVDKSPKEPEKKN